jgi:hypothetical protein
MPAEETMTKRIGKSKVLELVNQYLRKSSKAHLGQITVSAVPEQVERRNGCWNIGVRPSSQPRKLYEFYEALVDAEMELDEKHDLNVWLVPDYPK